ncbi:MAG: hypothetical protein WDM86_02975 [Rhizomicrobium sp.]
MAVSPLTPEAAVETSRIIEDDTGLTAGPSAVSVSPNRRRILVRLVRGDLRTNSLIMTMFSATIGADGTLSPLRAVAALRSSGLGAKDTISGPHQNSQSYYARLTWLGDDKVAFIWSDPAGINQVLAVDLRTGRQRFLTHHPSQVKSFSIGGRGQILYTAQARQDVASSRRLLASGFAVSRTSDIFGLVHGSLAGANTFDWFWNSSWFFQCSATCKPRSLNIDGRAQDVAPVGLVKLSPDGRYAIVSVAGIDAPSSWSKYGGEYQPFFRDAIDKRQTSASREVGVFYVLDMNTFAARPLWNAPRRPPRDTDEVTWAPDSKHVLISGTYLPIEDADPAGRSGEAAAVVDAISGTYQRLPIAIPDENVQAKWLSQGLIELDTRDYARGPLKVNYFRRDIAWTRVSAPPDGHAAPGIGFDVRQSVVRPPEIHTRDRQGSESLLLATNPDLVSRFRLGKVRYLTGQTTDNAWQATVYYPTDYKNGQRYPLVIQSDYGTYPTNIFSLYGLRDAGTGPSPIAPSVAQMLANLQFVVVEASVHSKDRQMHPEREAERNQATWETVIGLLDKSGLIDKTRVGISGFSRNGYYVEYALTHSRFPYAAAIAADNYDPSYINDGFFGWDSTYGDSNGAPPFGAGLQTWLKSAPGFNVEKIQSPLMIDAQTGGILSLMGYWEMFSRLNYLRYPVELWAIPDYEHAIHNTQNPRQIVAVEHRVIDWFQFWLNGLEDPDAAKRSQYAQWESLCDEQRNAHPSLTRHCIPTKQR